jgi:hypothetical protein|tara:strand:- start:946 stop:1338 length:393 start_codon:yes stop_codon:yes gene_type:complete
MKFLLVFFLLFPLFVYCGCEDGDCENGYGIYVWRNGDTDPNSWNEGDKYVGQFYNGKMHGQGIFYKFNGDVYIGSFNNGLKDGYGTYTYKNGSKYVGEYLNNLRHGKGVVIDDKGVSYSGFFRIDRLIKD